MSWQKHQEYDSIRASFYTELEKRMYAYIGKTVTVSTISAPVIDQAHSWEGRRYNWDWSAIHRKFYNIPSRLEVAVSVDQEVCGLLIGKPSRGKRHVTAYFLEGKPAPHPLNGQVLPILLDGLALYAHGLNCSHIRLMEPVEDLISRYQEAGFKVAQDNSRRLYCEQALGSTGT